ncbi:hypothetical protein SDC9_183016 [bioreactor metagenome]|uniref:Uncharacterized protein n=1 Tax=bioreactor metagenome TaxID=1076179 RepID=A0A645H956_9ZZZZ
MAFNAKILIFFNFFSVIHTFAIGFFGIIAYNISRQIKLFSFLIPPDVIIPVQTQGIVHRMGGGVS